MKIRSWLVAFFVASANAYGVTTIQMGVGGGFLTNLQNSSGAFDQTLAWGILVDTTGNGFLGGSYTSGFTVSDTSSVL
jgi:hypothetical protein